MNRETLRVVAVAFVCVLAIAFAAATLTSAVNNASGGFDLDRDQEQQIEQDPWRQGEPRDAGNSSDETPSNVSSGGVSMPCIEFFASSEYMYLVGGISIVGFLVLRRELETIDAIGFVLLVLFLAGVLSFVLASSCNMGPTDTAGSAIENITNTSGGDDGDEGLTGLISAPMLIIAMIFVVIVPVIFFMVRRADELGNRQTDPSMIDEEQDEEVLASLGELAGEAADRLESGANAVDNEVFRAWKEMTDLLNVENPESSTPAEFAEAARRAGMETSDVDQLTDLFVAVRYGGREANEDREQQAIDALRNIESEYAEPGSEEDEA